VRPLKAKRQHVHTTGKATRLTLRTEKGTKEARLHQSLDRANHKKKPAQPPAQAAGPNIRLLSSMHTHTHTHTHTHAHTHAHAHAHTHTHCWHPANQTNQPTTVLVGIYQQGPAQTGATRVRAVRSKPHARSLYNPPNSTKTSNAPCAAVAAVAAAAAAAQLLAGCCTAATPLHGQLKLSLKARPARTHGQQLLLPLQLLSAALLCCCCFTWTHPRSSPPGLARLQQHNIAAKGSSIQQPKNTHVAGLRVRDLASHITAQHMTEASDAKHTTPCVHLCRLVRPFHAQHSSSS
jgi:hypothetical protein